MLIRLLCAHEMTKHVCKISRLNSKRLLRKLQKMLGGYFFAALCRWWAVDIAAKTRRPLDHLKSVFAFCDPVTLTFDILTPKPYHF